MPLWQGIGDGMAAETTVLLELGWKAFLREANIVGNCFFLKQENGALLEVRELYFTAV